MAGWLHGVCVGACWLGSPQGGFSLSLFCNYSIANNSVSDITGPGAKDASVRGTRDGITTGEVEVSLDTHSATRTLRSCTWPRQSRPALPCGPRNSPSALHSSSASLAATASVILTKGFRVLLLNTIVCWYRFSTMHMVFRKPLVPAVAGRSYTCAAKKIFMENAMRDLSTTLCRGIARQVLASAPLRARLDGRPVLPGRPVPTDGLA